jgi:hypothetical protein
VEVRHSQPGWPRTKQCRATDFDIGDFVLQNIEGLAIFDQVLDACRWDMRINCKRRAIMKKPVYVAARTLAIAGALIASVAAADARGALAIGNCGAWGGSWNYDSDRRARDRALDECRGRNCKVVTSFSGLCAAFAIDRAKSCGAWGWATRESQRSAERVAIRECENAGGRDCDIRARFCDEK